MKLWIRSQDRENLLEVFDIYVENDHLVANYQSHYGGCNYTNIGEYKTKERALEVLDEIQNILKPKYIINTNYSQPVNSWAENGAIIKEYNADAKIEQLSVYVYEMPKE